MTPLTTAGPMAAVGSSRPAAVLAPSPAAPSALASVLRMHQTVGNRAVARMFGAATSPPASVAGRHEPPPVRRASRVVQRHTSPEHLVLGTMTPDRLATIADAHDLLRTFGKSKVDDANVQVAVHALSYERAKVRTWQQQPPTSVDDQRAWQTRLTEIDNPSGGPPVIATYGEMNTLADYFGSLDDLKAVSNTTMRQVLQTIREEYYNWLGTQLKELMQYDYIEKDAYIPDPRSRNVIKVKQRFYKREGGTEYDSPATPGLKDQEFADTQSGLGVALKQPAEALVSHITEQAGADLAVRNDPGTQARGSGGAWGAIARNACHFAPQNWFAWKKYHVDAVVHAHDAHAVRKRLETEKGLDALLRDKLKQEAADAENEAWLAESFGGHYLQDAFASGHLINKTMIMQWFLEYASTFKFVGPSGSAMARMGQMTEARQPGLATTGLYAKSADRPARGPQAASEQATAAEEFETAGLKSSVQGHALEVLRWWRAQPSRPSMTVMDFWKLQTKRQLPVSFVHTKALEATLDNLVSAGLVARNTGLGIRATSYDLRESPHLSKKVGLTDTSSYDPAKTLTLGSYHEFMNNAMIQSGAGALHDYFCKKGLDVKDDKGNTYKVYGDSNLLAQGAGTGVRFLGEAVEMARTSVQDALDTGNEPKPSTEKIMARFPSQARLPADFDGQPVPNAGTMLPLLGFQRALRPQMNQVWENWGHWFVARLPTRHARAGLVEPGQVSPHSGEEF